MRFKYTPIIGWIVMGFFLTAGIFCYFIFYNKNLLPEGMRLIPASFEEEEDVILEEITLPPESGNLPVSSFGEVWAYLMEGREYALNPGRPISDLVYFNAEVDTYGKLTALPDPGKLSSFKGRLHLIIACNGRALTHFAIEEGSNVRKQLINDIIDASQPYQGLQIDFEYVPAKDGEAFLSFLKELRRDLKGKMFTVALPARSRTIADDVYDYKKIAGIVDRILVMAYDEHWSTSEPGPIASMDWCQRVAAYSLRTIGSEKLIMGLPFYGRSWGSFNANRAYMHSSIENLKKEQNITRIDREKGIPYFKYQTPLDIVTYYEDGYSLSARMEMYRNMGVKSIGFWALSQETPEIWNLIKIE
ncbi:MAG: glycoside hydrolase [Treponema sp.]|jgi:spore germination protein YaaH|nr:glycoside hydrolase [Treponema sp.]